MYRLEGWWMETALNITLTKIWVCMSVSMVTDVPSLCGWAVCQLTMYLFISTFPHSALHEQYECDFVVKCQFEIICLGRDQGIKTKTWCDKCLKDEGQQSQDSLQIQTVHTLHWLWAPDHLPPFPQPVKSTACPVSSTNYDYCGQNAVSTC